jgi:hypothetical protein
MAMPNPLGHPGHPTTAMLRSQRIRTPDGRWRYTGKIELICYDCGDDPALDYPRVSPLLRRVRGPYPTMGSAQDALKLHWARCRGAHRSW